MNLADPAVAAARVAEIGRCWNQTVATSNHTAVFEDVAVATSNHTAVFEDVYSSRAWAPRGGPLSGLGSSVSWTSRARAALMHTIVKYHVKYVVDAPCGDLTWMRTLFPLFETMGVRYTGVDVVATQIAKHRARFAKAGVRDFHVLDLTATPPPAGDLIFSRQAMQHLNAQLAMRVLHQFSRVPRVRGRGVPLLLTTSYQLGPERWDENYRRKEPGAGVILLDFRRAPFSLPPPLEVFEEQHRTDDGLMRELLLLWQLPLRPRKSPEDMPCGKASAHHKPRPGVRPRSWYQKLFG